MSLSSWKNDLKNVLKRDPQLRVALLGIGNELNGDDAAGVWVARGLKQAIQQGRENSSPLSDSRLLVIDAGVGPEAYTGVLRRFQPELVLLIDAAAMGEPPGSILVVDCSLASGFGASTHTQSPSTLAEFLTADLGCRVLLVGIQPGQVDFDIPVTKPVQEAVHQLVAYFQTVCYP
jgi:hydrogenase 3 maturation protease